MPLSDKGEANKLKKMAKRHIVNDGKLFKRTKEHEDRDVSIAWALGRRSG